MKLTSLGEYTKDIVEREGLIEFYDCIEGCLSIPIVDFKRTPILCMVMSLLDIEVFKYEGVKYSWVLFRDCSRYIVKFVKCDSLT